MKLLLSIMLLAGTCLVSCSSDNGVISSEAPVNRVVRFEVYASKDYSPPATAGVQADVKLEVSVTSRLYGNRVVIWDSTFPRRNLPDFPLLSQKISVEKTVEVVEGYEQLTASAYILYDDAGVTTTNSFTEGLITGQPSVILNVGL